MYIYIYIYIFDTKTVNFIKENHVLPNIERKSYENIVCGALASCFLSHI